jgi:hypothetical protein
MSDELKRNLEQIKVNLERLKNNSIKNNLEERLKHNPDFPITQEHFEDLFFEGWNRGAKQSYVKENGRWIKND